MASATSYRRGFSALLVILLSALLFYFGNGLNPLWPLLWFAPLPLLSFALRHSWWSAVLTTTFALLLGELNLWHYFRVLGLPPIAWISTVGVGALVLTAAVLLFRTLVLHGSPWGALLAFPAVWVSFEFVHNLTSIHGTAGSLAYSQLGFLPFLQLASITGPWGMSFLLLLFPAALAIGLHLHQSQPKQAKCIIVTSLGVIALALIFGAIRLAMPKPEQQVRVGLITSDEPKNANITAPGAETERLFHDYAKEIEQLTNRGAQVIVLPEKLGVVVDPNNKSMDNLFQSLADKTRSTIVVGLVHVSPPVKYNQARVYVPEGSVMSYNKHHMLPPFESNLKPGTSILTMPRSSGTWGVAICKDMDFTPLSRKYGRAGVDLMLIPGWDFNLDRGWHGHIAIMRAVEDGFSLVRAAKNGYLTVSDNRGRILAEARSDSAPFATLLTEVPVVHNNTPYLLLGDWFGWTSVAILLLVLLSFLRL